MAVEVEVVEAKVNDNGGDDGVKADVASADASAGKAGGPSAGSCFSGSRVSGGAGVEGATGGGDATMARDWRPAGGRGKGRDGGGGEEKTGSIAEAGEVGAELIACVLKLRLVEGAVLILLTSRMASCCL